MEKLKLTLDDIKAVSGECLPVIHNAINAGHLRTFVVGRRRFSKPSTSASGSTS